MIKDENDTSLLNGCAWGKAIKRKFFEHLVFPENYWYEDSIIAHLVVPRANSIYMVSKCQYAYRSNPTGITKTSVSSLRAIESFYMQTLEDGFKAFFANMGDKDILKAEYLLPIYIDELLQAGRVSVKVLDTNDKWFGVTYKEDTV